MTMFEVQAIPASIVSAICQIKVTLESVKKTQRNAHGGYNFASTDDIYAALTKKMGDVGLVCLGLEDECEIVRVEKDGKTSQWARLKFSFVWATKDATWTDPRACRSLYIQVTGPQTFQAAQSYAEKAYLRSTFKLPTGDLDLDAMPQADNEDEQVALNGNGTKRKSSAAAKRDGTDKIFNELVAAIKVAPNSEALRQLRTENADAWNTAPPRWEEILTADYETQMDALLAREAA